MWKTYRLKAAVRGAVQGVGFRPFIYRLATEMGLKGSVANSPQGVFIEAEGPADLLESFLLRIEREKPPRASIQSLESAFLDPKGYSSFKIGESSGTGEKTALILPDIGTCEECLNEIFDPGNRRYHYPFTNCTNCGPRFSIIEALPYDRAHTTMRMFTMCDVCQAEYEDPRDRRYHAQPNACPHCGPHLEFLDSEGRICVNHVQALLESVKAIRWGQVAAVKGLGGFHLITDAANESAVLRLRQRKHRQVKPFALMMSDVDMAKKYCEVSELEERLLRSPEAPIVLLRAKKNAVPGVPPIAASVAPGNPNLGVMLPSTPLHHILMRQLNIPVVATSGNVSEEPIVIHDKEALTRLAGIADFFLIHNRPIARPVDDSIVRIMMGRKLVLRRSRGFAPLPFEVGHEGPCVLSVGAQLKSTVAQSIGKNVFVSQHIGDLSSAETFRAFRQAVETFQEIYERKGQYVSCDLHPDYLSTQFARCLDLPTIHVQHHYAHILACMADNELEGPALGVAWDGTGFGTDGSLWGGEFLRVDPAGFTRVGHFRTFRLPGSERAVREGRRAALGLLYEVFGDPLFSMKKLNSLEAFSAQALDTLKMMLKRGVLSPQTSSAGRLFDGVSSILGLCQIHRFEGQAAMELEFAIGDIAIDGCYPVLFSEENALWIFDWEPMIYQILSDLDKGIGPGEISAKFHNTLAEAILQLSIRAKESKIVLSGGCFQNKYLLERTVRRLTENGFVPYWHQRIPPNDGGICLGQAVAAMQYLKRQKAVTRQERRASCV
ncbi:MAG: carbamoyltransferase HypF [Candidatus Omnitrophica bacterium CG07_land_8_20_14_0_80_50_8]|nr:MAG: carbamoyltransferase HypF [Candidatus Omnitrophica bacterium CG07_land_8_20_14_0_80_50_8]